MHGADTDRGSAAQPMPVPSCSRGLGSTARRKWRACPEARSKHRCRWRRAH